MTRSTKVLYLISLLLGISVVALLLHGPVLQSDAYHHFADDRTLLSHVSNTLNVLSNLAFLLPLIVLLKGLSFYLHNPSSGAKGGIKLSAYIFAIGSCGVALGSSYYHAHPTSSTLVWDRLPMTICFAAIFAEFLRQYVSKAAGTVSLWFLLAFGIQSVMYWQIIGDLRPYVLVQFFPLVAIPLIASIIGTETRTFARWLRYLANPAERSTRLWRNAFLCYGVAKVLEALDASIYTLTDQLVSGHSLKHIASGIACAYAFMAIMEYRDR